MTFVSGTQQNPNSTLTFVRGTQQNTNFNTNFKVEEAPISTPTSRLRLHQLQHQLQGANTAQISKGIWSKMQFCKHSSDLKGDLDEQLGALSTLTLLLCSAARPSGGSACAWRWSKFVQIRSRSGAFRNIRRNRSSFSVPPEQETPRELFLRLARCDQGITWVSGVSDSTSEQSDPA